MKQLFFRSTSSKFQKPREHYSKRLLGCVFTIALVGCNGTTTSVGAGDPDEPNEPILVDDGPTLKAEAVDSLIKGSLIDYYTRIGSGSGRGEFVALETTDAMAIAAPTTDGDTSGGFSTTNLQEAGVDEADRVKIDGDLLFSLEDYNVQYPFPEVLDVEIGDAVGIAADSPPFWQQGALISVYRLAADNSQVLSRNPLQLDSYSPSGMYLQGSDEQRELILISASNFPIWDHWGDMAARQGLNTRISWYSASDPASLSQSRVMDLEGQLISSRKIGSRLVIVTRFDPQPPGLYPYPATEAEFQANRTVIEAADVETLLPGYTLTEGDTTTQRALVVGSNECYTSRDSSAEEVLPAPSVVTISTIDLSAAEPQLQSTCFLGQSETMYVSTEALYLATTQYSYSFITDAQSRPLISYANPEITTDVHKFSLQSAVPQFKGSASVAGHLGWYPDRKPFRMSEKDGNLRIVSFDEQRSGSPVTLTILAESDNERLQTLATLPNDARPQQIGKTGEKLYASRFIGDRGYLVTFRVTDPLYVLDMSDPMDPRIAGELELPGYSDYLHPVNEGLLLGVGKDAVADSGEGWGDGRGAWYQGLKLALFDVSDPANPSVADSLVIGKRFTDSPALSQHHAFAWLAAGEGRNARFALPVSLHDGEKEGSQLWEGAAWTSNKMLKMEVNEENKAFETSLDWVFESVDNGQQGQYLNGGIYNDRAIIGEAGDFYVIHQGSLHYGQWDNAAATSQAR